MEWIGRGGYFDLNFLGRLDPSLFQTLVLPYRRQLPCPNSNQKAKTQTPSQTVFRLTSRNCLDDLQAFKEPIPTPDKYEVLIKVRSVSLNYRDVLIATSRYSLPVKEQVIPCSDMSGEIVKVGDLVCGFSIGDKVLSPIDPSLLYGTFKDAANTFGGFNDGMLREYIALPAHVIIKLPSSSHSFTQWSSVITTGSTVWNAFYGNKALKPGDTVLLLGTGGVSMTALIFAKAAGATTIITSSSDEKLEYVKARFGADHTINYITHPNWAAEVQRITNGQGADHVVEVGGMATIQQSIESVAYGGVVSIIGSLTSLPQDKMPDILMSTIVKGAVVRGVMGGSKQQLEEVVRFIGSRELQIPVDKTFNFNREDVIKALDYVASGKHIGKVSINLD